MTHSPFQPYWNMILAERDWSWSVIGIAYLLAAFFVRSWFLAPLVSRARDFDRAVFRHIKGGYLKNSLLGWGFFFLPLGFIVLLWRPNLVPVRLCPYALAAAGAGSFILSVLFHLQAFGIGALTALRRAVENQEKKLFE